MQHSEGRFIDPRGLGLYSQQWQPEGDVKACVLLVHGMAEHGGRYAHLAEAFTARGYAICALDLPGHGKSEGVRVFVESFTHYLESVDAYLQQLQNQFADVPMFLLGHSMGGLISSNYLRQNQNAFAGVVLSGAALASPLQPPMLMLFIVKLLSAILPKTRVLQLDAAGVSRDPAVVESYKADPLNYGGKICARTVAELFRSMDTVNARWADISVPLLILHGQEDSMAAASGSEAMYQGVGSKDKTLHVYPGLYHEIFNEPEQKEIFAEVLDWLDQRVP